MGEPIKNPLTAAPIGCMMENRYLLSDDSGKIQHKNRACQLRLGVSDLFIFDVLERKTTRILSFASVIGSRSFSIDADRSTLEIYDYKFDDSGYFRYFKNTKLRKCETISFQFTDSSTCQHWSNAINHTLYYQPQQNNNIEGGSSSEEGSSLLSDTYLSAPAAKRFTVFVNPVSGRGQAVATWKNLVEPMMIQAGIQVKLITTQHANHARDIMEDFDASTCDCVMTIGGDGVLFEIINGLSSRSKGDGEALLSSVPVAPVPGGTGNGLIKSILFECGQELSVINAVFMALKGTTEVIDLSLVQTRSHTYRSFLLLGWGLISDIDLLSESMRYLGELRLYLAAVYFVIKKRFYRGRLSMFTGDSNGLNVGVQCPISLPSFDKVIPAGNGWEVIDASFLFVWVVQTSHVTATMYSGPGVTSDDGMFTVYVVTDMSRCEILQLLLAMDTGGHVKHPKVKTFKCTAYRIEPFTDAGRNSNSNSNSNSNGNSNGGLYTLDGELVEYGPIQGIMRPGSGRIRKFKH